MMAKIGLIFIALVAGLVSYFQPQLLLQSTPTPIPVVTISPTVTPTPTSIFTPSLITHSVPFVAQAPRGVWSDPRQQDGCEEAASLMAVLWSRGEKAPGTLAEQEAKIIEISEFEQKNYNSYHDTSAHDTGERILKDYFKFENFEVLYDFEVEDLINVLQENVVIVPADGQALKNPNFTPPGPERHMLLVTGYDPKTREFITHDNGTRQGKNYRYKESVLFNAIRDYKTGYHEPIEGRRKAMIVVHK